VTGVQTCALPIFLGELGVPLLTGAPVVLDWERYDATNSAILLSPEGNTLFSYAKMHPVPFAESIPFWEYGWMRNFMSDVVGLEGGWVMGTEATVMEVPTPSGRPLRFGVPICFEDAFPSVCAAFFRNGADLLVNITNDSWSLTVSAETQHFVAARFRAIEFRRVLVRSTNGGVTAVVDAEGRTLAQLPLFTEAVLPVDVPVQIAAAPTTYYLLGDWFPALLAVTLFLFLLADFRRSADHDRIETRIR
jgi:apolipoprotein N-acyltransferase